MAAPHVFIDTNVWLAFYSFTKDDVEQLRKLIKLIEKEKLRLYVTQQLADEFYRNRERKLDESLRAFGRGEIPKSLPRYLMDYPEAADFEKAVVVWQKVRDSLVERAKKDASDRTLAADTLFQDVLKATAPATVGSEIISKALNRRLLGNPPGKYPSLGDQINWEILLRDTPEDTDLHIVSKDGDFESRLIPGRADQFLIDEWKSQKNGNLFVHSELRTFFTEHFPDIKLASDVERKDAINELVNSGSFSTTHSAVAKVQTFLDELSWTEADAVLTAALTNKQISWISTDSDVASLYNTLMAKFSNKIAATWKTQLEALFKPEVQTPIVDENDDDVPF